MNTNRVLATLTALLAGLTAIGGLDLSGVANFLPPGWAAVLATVPPLMLAAGHTVLAIGDQLDDGKKNDSFPRRPPSPPAP